MNHTGVYGTASPRQAFKKGEFVVIGNHRSTLRDEPVSRTADLGMSAAKYPTA
jgi:hypothetical protein